MTAMPPTKGHGHLIRWGYEYCERSGRSLTVIVGTQPSEPMGEERYAAVSAFCRNLVADYPKGTPGIRVVHQYEEIQQYPSGPDDEQFWQKWCGRLNDIVSYRKLTDPVLGRDIIISSESYGAELAKRLGCQSVVVDPKREVTGGLNATRIRQRPWFHADEILPEFLPYVQQRITIFGAESTGKSTLLEGIHKNHVVNYTIPEWARTYLESLSSPEVTEDRMEQIVLGQYATMESTRKLSGAFSVAQDTDLLTTIGYYRMFFPNHLELKGYRLAVDLFHKSKSDLYLMLLSNIPFTPDPLRYGGDERQGTDEFWENLLKEFECRYRIIPDPYQMEKIIRATRSITELYNENPIWGFKRDKADA